MINTLVDNGTIRLGYVSDNEATVIQFPIANIYALLGNGGEFYLLNKRPLDETAYAVPPSQITTDENFLYWTVSAYDVEVYGNGECQLQYRVGDTVKMSQKWRTAISSSLVDGGEVPTPYETWLDDLADIADRAEAATEHYPQIGENGNWYVWDVNAGAFVDTGFPSGGTTYHAITESGTAGNYDLELNAHVGIGGNVDGSGSASFAGDIISAAAVKSDNFAGASGGVPITFDAAHGSLDIVNADDGVSVDGNVVVGGGVTAESVIIESQGGNAILGVQVDGALNIEAPAVTIGSDGAKVATEPVILYAREDPDDGTYWATDENGNIYTRKQLLDLYKAGRTFELCDIENAWGSYNGSTYPLSVIENVSSDYGEEAYILGTPLSSNSNYDGSTNPALFTVETLLDSSEGAYVNYYTFNYEDNKVGQIPVSTNAAYRVLLSDNANDSYETSQAKKSSKLKFTPSSGRLDVDGSIYVNDTHVYTADDGPLWGDYTGEDVEMLADNIQIFGGTNTIGSGDEIIKLDQSNEKITIQSDDTIELDAPTVNVIGDLEVNGVSIAPKQYRLVLDVTADGTQTEYSVSRTCKKVVIYTRMPISAAQPIMYYKIDGTTRGYTQSNSSYARDGMMIADCSEGLLLSQFCPNANAGSAQALQTYPSYISAQTSISTVSFSLSSGTEIPSGTIIKVYAIS